MGKHIIGYLTWEDFLKELEAARPRTVRVQPHHHTVPKSNPPLVQFWVEAAFLTRDEIHVAKFFIGSEFDFNLRHDPGRAEHFQRLMGQAERILIQALEPRAEVRRGMFSGTDRIRIRTSPEGLWRWERDGDKARLVPEIPIPQEVQT